MADTVSVEVEGPTLASELERWARQVPEDLTQNTRSLASLLVEDVRRKVPVLTGTLAASVTETEEYEEGGGFGVGMGEDVIYAGWIEFGGSRGRPEVPEGRYVYPTLVQTESMVQSGFSEALTVSIDRFGWSTGD
jgi:hypothetical protein